MSVARFWSIGDEVLSRHPNELDLRRIERAIKDRKRYRYVVPTVLPDSDGYLIRSACCSRTIDAQGGEIDVARLQWSDSPPGWALMRKDHVADQWITDSEFSRLSDLFARLNTDPDRVFWQ